MKKAFTLVELIVVVTILAILGAIGFVSYNGYLSGVRDTNRTSQLTSLHDGLELYRTRKDLPDPDLKVEIKNGTEILGYQGYAGSGVLNTIEFVKGGKDPKDNGYFTYYLDSSKREFQLLAYLEDEENVNYLLGGFVPKASAAVDYTNRYPIVYGKKLGILVDDITNAPVQETMTGALNLQTSTGTYQAYFKNDNVVTSSGSALVSEIKDNRYTRKQYSGEVEISCNKLLELYLLDGQDGLYNINPTGASQFQTYCDMTTDGGGWSLVTYEKFAPGSGRLIDKNKYLQLFKNSYEALFTYENLPISGTNYTYKQTVYSAAVKTILPSPSTMTLDFSNMGSCVKVSYSNLIGNYMTGDKYTYSNVLGYTWNLNQHGIGGSGCSAGSVAIGNNTYLTNGRYFGTLSPANGYLEGYFGIWVR